MAALAQVIGLEAELGPEISSTPESSDENLQRAEPQAQGSDYAVVGQLLLGLSLALFSEDVQQLTPWGGAGSGVLATALLLPAMALLFGPAVGLLDDFRRQAPGMGDTIGRALGMMAVGGGLALALVGLAGGMRSPNVTADGAESYVQEWAAKSGLSLHREGATSLYRFAYTATLDNGFALTIGRPKGRENYLTFQSEIRLGAQHRSLFDSMSRQSQLALVDSLSEDLSGQGVTPRLEPPATIRLESLTPISALSDSLLDAKLAEMKTALTSARGAIQRQLR
jgi:hypothetical protein